VSARVVLCAFALAAGCSASVPFPDELVRFAPLTSTPALAPEPGRWDDTFIERGFVRKESDGYWLWFTGEHDGDVSHRALGLAWSPDGLAFDRVSPDPIYDASHVEDVFVFAADGQYYIFCEGEGDQAQWLTSPDRVHWTHQGAIDVRQKDGTPLSSGPYGTPSVVIEGDTWYLLYERRDDGIWLAASRDHRTFVNVDDEPVIPLGPGSYDEARVSLNQVVQYQGRYYAFYNAQGRGPEWTTAVASSSDLVHWDKFAGNPILDRVIAVLTQEPEGFRLYSMSPTVSVFASAR
jgi:hypothetical protein